MQVRREKERGRESVCTQNVRSGGGGEELGMVFGFPQFQSLLLITYLLKQGHTSIRDLPTWGQAFKYINL